MSLRTPVIINQSKVRIPNAFVKSWCRNLHKELSRYRISADGDLTIVFMDTVEAKKLNRQYRQKNYATDVLSFLDPEELGDLVICPQVIERQAKEHGHSFQEELGYMILHGVLHLLGFDHEKTKKEAKLMFKLQDDLFSVLQGADKSR